MGRGQGRGGYGGRGRYIGAGHNEPTRAATTPPPREYMRLTERAQHLMDVLNGNAGNRPLSPVNGRVAATDDELDSMFAAERKTWGNSIVSPEHRQWFRRIEDTLVSNTGRDIDQEVMRRVLPRLNASTTWRETMRIGRAIEDLNYHDVAAVAFHRAALQFAAAS